jgi:hypothetical protein
VKSGIKNKDVCVCVYVYIYIHIHIYRANHDRWTLLQEMIFSDFLIKKVHINMCPILERRTEGKDY